MGCLKTYIQYQGQVFSHPNGERITTPISNNDLDDYKKVKEEMDRLGFKLYDEYYDYLDFINTRNKRMS